MAFPAPTAASVTPDLTQNIGQTLEQARQAIGDYVTNYHHRPHSRLDYNTPLEVAATWSDPQDHPTPAA
jgi:hypothetical protein